MNGAILQQLKEISKEEQEILSSGKPVLSYYSTDPESVTESGCVFVRSKRMITILKHPRFVEFPNHAHNCLEIIYVVNGSLEHTIQDSIHLTLAAGDLLFIQPGTCHSTRAADYNDIALHFLILPEFLRFPVDMLIDDTVFRRFMKRTLDGLSSSPPYIHFHLQDMLKAQNLLENIVYTLLSNQRNKQRILRLTISALLLELTQLTYKITQGTPTGYEQELVLKALSYIENNYQTATLEEFCQTVNQPTYYISRLMKKYSPYTFTKYIQRRRLAQAVYLLTETSVPIEDIIVQVGYENSSHFHRLFKQEYGQSPKAYRKNYLEHL